MSMPAHNHYATLAYLDYDGNEVDVYCECGEYLGSLAPIQIEARDKETGFIYARSSTTLKESASIRKAREMDSPPGARTFPER
jgi:hypothetical protein